MNESMLKKLIQSEAEKMFEQKNIELSDNVIKKLRLAKSLRLSENKLINNLRKIKQRREFLIKELTEML